MVNLTRRPSGFVLIGVVFLAFVVSLTLAALARLWEADAQRDRERELLWAGRQIGKALSSYALLTPEGAAAQPRSLDELVLDTRVVPPVRHLRRIPVDPMTGTVQWGVVRTAEGTIAAVHSISAARPMPADSLWPEERTLAAARTYSLWVFGPVATMAPPPSASTAAEE